MRLTAGVLRTVGIATLALMMGGTSARGAIISSETGDHNYRLDGRVRQTVGIGYNRILQGSRFQVIDNAYLLESVFNYSWKNEIRFKLTTNFQGDAVYRFRRSSNSFGSRGVDLNTGSNDAFIPYGRNSSHSESYRDDCRNSPDCNFIRDHLIREASITFANKNAGYNITVGKFQRGLGQADGLRLMDIINPLDFRKRFLLRDFDELRIEQWMVDAIFFIEPFFSLQKIGIINPNVEFIFIPNVRHTEFNINNSYNDEGGGIWAFDLPSEDAGFDNSEGRLNDGVYFNLTRKFAADSWMDMNDAAYAARLSWNMFHGEFTVTGYYGWQDLFVTRVTGATVHAGVDGRGPVLLEATPELSELAYYGLLGNELGLENPLTVGQQCTLLGGPPVPGGCSVVGNVDLDFGTRKKLIGATATREIPIYFPPRGVAPVLRVEASYEFDKAFNTPRLVAPDSVSTREHDFVSVMVGEDFFLWLPNSFYYIPWVQQYLFYQPRGIFTSFQLFWFKVMGQGAGFERVLFQSPYPDWKRPANEFWMTFLWFTDVYGDLIHLEGLNVYETAHSSYILRQRVDFKLFGDHFFPRLEVIHLEGRGDQVGGVFDSNDMVAIDLLYQF